MHKVAICGHFGFGATLLNGQTVKTKILTEELESQLGAKEIKKIDTHGGVMQIIRSVLSAVLSMFTCRNLIILPAHNGVRVFGPILGLVRKFSRCKLHYAVIGGWLPEMVEGNPSLARSLKKFDYIYVETTTMQKLMEKQGFQNIVVMPNCKNLVPLSEVELVYHNSAPFPLCTFSRVMEEKGIEDAANAVKQINEHHGKIVYTLDIYGPIDPGYQERFVSLQEGWPEYIRYKGSVAFNQSVNVLKDYFALLFPTRFFTEGIPGTIIDAYAAGVPVISAKWESFADIVDIRTGFVYDFSNTDALVQQLSEVAQKPNIVSEKKTNCLIRAKDFIPHNVTEVITTRLDVR